MKVFDSAFFQKLTDDARNNSRGRQHRNIHNSYAEPAQRLFNAIEPLSYIRPHRHASDPREELLVAMRGKLALLVFDDHGHITRAVRLGAESSGPAFHAAVEVSSADWHTVIALTPGSVLLEVKAGPFDPERPKDYAPWAPEEATAEAIDYLGKLLCQISSSA
jgi:cupin fold WbuC family metalloprotein